MGRSGRLRGLGLAKELATAGASRWSGLVEVTASGGAVVHLHLLDGLLVRAERADESAEQALADYLRRTESASPIAISEALEQHRRTGRDLVELLAETRAAPAKALRAHLERLTTDRFFETFEWSAGRFQAHADATRVRRLAIEPMDVEALVADAGRVAEEWPVIAARVVDGRCYRRLRTADAATDESELGPSEVLVHTLVREDRDAAALEDLSRLGRFETRRALYRLLERSLVAPATGGAADAGARARRGAARSRIVHALVNMLLLVALALIAVAAARRHVGAPLQTVRGDLAGERGRLQARLSANQMARIRTSLEVSWMHHGTYPSRLGELVEAHLLRESDLTFPWYQEQYFYERRGERSYELVQPLR